MKPSYYLLLHLQVPHDLDDALAISSIFRVILRGVYDSYDDAESEAMIDVARRPDHSVRGYTIVER